MIRKPEYEGRWKKDDRRKIFVPRPSSLVPRILLLFSVACFLFSAAGCEAFVRKFTRKPKTEQLPKEEMVLAPEEYKAPQMTSEESYRQHFLFWKSWQDELINVLSPGANHKKQIGCIREAKKNISSMKALLNTEKQQKLDVYIGQLNDLNEAIARDVYGNNAAAHRQNAERIKRNISRDFSYKRVKEDLIK